MNGTGPSWQPGQVWRNAGHLNFVAAGQRFTSIDLDTMHTWTVHPRGLGGFPAGGNGGQWFQKLPRTVDGSPAPAGSPTHIISTSGRSSSPFTGGWFPFTLGWYHAENESFTAGPVWNADAGSQFTWASMQQAGDRTMIVAWISASGIAPSGSGSGSGSVGHHQMQQAGPQAPNSALSLMREIMYDVEIGTLVSSPAPELAQLRNGTLFSQGDQPLRLEPTPGKLFTLPLTGDADAGATMDLVVNFLLPETAGALRFGVAVLASDVGLINATVIRINVSAPDATGNRAGMISTAIEHPSRPPAPPPPAPSPGPAQPFTRMMKGQIFHPHDELFHKNMPLHVDPAKCGALCDNTSGCGAWMLIPTPEHGGTEDTRCHILGALNATGCPNKGADGTWCGAKVAGNFSCSIIDHHPVKPRWPLYWSAPFNVTKGQASVDLRVLLDRSVSEVFVQGGRASGLLAYTPLDTAMSHVHLFAEGDTAVEVSGAQAWSMSCGWNVTGHR